MVQFRSMCPNGPLNWTGFRARRSKAGALAWLGGSPKIKKIKKSKTSKTVQFRSMCPNMVQFRSMCPNWPLDWTVRLQSQAELGWGSSLAWGKPQHQKNQKPQKRYSLGLF